MIPFKRINLGWSHLQLKPYFESGMIGLGDAVFAFEKELAQYTGAKYALALNSCTSALFLSLLWDKMQGVKHVKIPSMTVPLVPNAIIQAGLTYSFDERTDWVGGSYEIYGSKTIDSAHELFRNCYKIFDATQKVCFSFYPTKTIGSADGGAIVTDDLEFISWARKASVYGRNQQDKRQSSWDYDVAMLGYKMNWNNLQAVIALEQLRRLDDTNAKRQVIVAQYNKAFKLSNDSDYLYRIKIRSRDLFLEYMLENGVECGVHFKPLHLMTPFRDIPTANAEVIENAYAKTVSLPLYDTLTNTEVEKIIELVQKWKGVHD